MAHHPTIIEGSQGGSNVPLTNVVCVCVLGGGCMDTDRGLVDCTVDLAA